MRDEHRMREKLELRLEGHQIFTLAFGGAILVAVAFVAGIVVGRHSVAVPVDPPASGSLLTQLDRQEAVREETVARAQGEVESPNAAFHEALTAPQPAVATKRPEPKADLPTVPADDPTPAATPATPASTSQASAPAPSAEEKSDLPDGYHRDAVAPADGTLDPTWQHVPAGQQAYALQVSAFRSRSQAEEYADRLREHGHRVYLVSATIPNKGQWYRVRVGRFADIEDAKRFRDDFERQEGITAFVVKAE